MPEDGRELEPPEVDADQRERIVFQFLRDVPFLLNADRLGMETCTVKPWPHQNRVADTIVQRFPERFMLCDEVGLGKTIEAGMAIRQLDCVGRGQAGADPRAQERPGAVAGRAVREVRPEHPPLRRHTFYDVFGREVPRRDDGNPWEAHPIFLASSQLAKRRERQTELLEAQDWDLVVVDEAHHARRKDFLNKEQFRPNRLLELLLGTEGRPGLAEQDPGPAAADRHADAGGPRGGLRPLEAPGHGGPLGRRGQLPAVLRGVAAALRGHRLAVRPRDARRLLRHRRPVGRSLLPRGRGARRAGGLGPDPPAAQFAATPRASSGSSTARPRACFGSSPAGTRRSAGTSSATPAPAAEVPRAGAAQGEHPRPDGRSPNGSR